MAPCKVVFLHAGGRLDLVVPVIAGLTFRAFLEMILKRASKHCDIDSTAAASTRLALNSENGFLVDEEDVVDNVMTVSDVLYVSWKTNQASLQPDPQSEFRSSLQSAAHRPGLRKFAIRVITPLAAQRHEDHRHIPLLRHGRQFTNDTTLREIKTEVLEHLGLPVQFPENPETNHCSCKVAEQLVERGQWQKARCGAPHHQHKMCQYESSGAILSETTCARCAIPLSGHTPVLDEGGHCKSYILRRGDLACGHIIHNSCLKVGQDGKWACPTACYSMQPAKPLDTSTIIVISGRGQVDRVNVEAPTLSAITTSLKAMFGNNFDMTQCVHMKGGVEVGEGGYSVMPVAAVCSRLRHRERTPTLSANETTASHSGVDLHTAEGPIETIELDMTLEDSRLGDLVVNGVLPLYAVERKSNGSPTLQGIGKDALYKTGLHWQIPATQSDRATAAFLSCMRVFAHICGAEDFVEAEQDEVLRQYLVVTGFPPAVRALHILMDGKSLRQNECAALVQSTSAVLQELIPRNIIEDDSRRALEGSRLLLGLILHHAKKEMKSLRDETSSEERFSYLGGFHTADLRDIKTLEPVADPVQTHFGLLEKKTYLAFANGGLLGFSPSDDIEQAAAPDRRVLRVAKLFGGFGTEVSYYDSDLLARELIGSRSSTTLAKEIKAYSQDLQWTAMLCQSTLGVIAPKALSGTNFPCLTLDREGYMAVYTGPPVCAPPDRDRGIYRPLTGREENIDANIVAQLLEPIIKVRERDGTHYFDLFSTTYGRKEAATTELLVFCVDCSASMDESSDFAGVNDEDGQPLCLGSVQDDVHMEDEDDAPIEFNEIKEWLITHESIQDMLAIVYAAGNRRPRCTAEEIIQFLRTLTSRHIAHLAKESRETTGWASYAYVTTRQRYLQKKMDELRRTLAGLNIYEEGLCDMLLFKVRETDFTLDAFDWEFGEAIPVVQRPAAAYVDLSAEFSTPAEFICPISQAVFKDPVTTSDDFTFERRSIERWYRIRHSSPLTGLPISNTTLRRNQPLFDQIQAWSQATDVAQAAPSTPKRLRSVVSSKLALTIVAPTGTFIRTMPASLTLADLHKIVYRGMRGVHSHFTLHTNGRLLAASDETLRHAGVTDGSQVVANPDSALAPSNSQGGSPEEMCLVRLYTPENRENHQDMSFWLPKTTPVSLASVIFRFWRKNQESSSFWADTKDREAWSGLCSIGDSRFVGTRHNSWDGIAELLGPLRPIKVVPSEAMCKANVDGKDTSPSDLDSDSESETSRNGSVPPPLLYRVLKLELSSYRSPEAIEAKRIQKLRTLTRMGISKQVFGSFINRLIAYNYPTKVGLVTFGTKATSTLPLTDTIENFRSAIDNMDVTGDTSLWDALALAADQLIHEPGQVNVKKRIFCLSDGQDTNSSRRAQDVCRLLLHNSITVDSCSIGNVDNAELRALSFLTGGYKFVPKTLEEAVAICELEPVLSQHERPPMRTYMTSGLHTDYGFSRATTMAMPDPVSRDIFPARKSHPNIDDSFVRITAFERTAPAVSVASSEHSQSSLRFRRLLTEVREIAARPHPSYDVYVSETNMGFWKVVLSGPSGSAYATGTFVLYLDMGEDYPRGAPKGRFVTSIFHPNINRHGRICHSIFDRNWTVDTTNRQVLDTVFGLLLVPEFTDPINTVVTLDYYWDEVAFKTEVEKHIAKHANKGREVLGLEILSS